MQGSSWERCFACELRVGWKTKYFGIIVEELLRGAELQGWGDNAFIPSSSGSARVPQPVGEGRNMWAAAREFRVGFWGCDLHTTDRGGRIQLKGSSTHPCGAARYSWAVKSSSMPRLWVYKSNFFFLMPTRSQGPRQTFYREKIARPENTGKTHLVRTRNYQ